MLKRLFTLSISNVANVGCAGLAWLDELVVVAELLERDELVVATELLERNELESDDELLLTDELIAEEFELLGAAISCTGDDVVQSEHPIELQALTLYV